mgnify:CR=1 FL=1
MRVGSVEGTHADWRYRYRRKRRWELRVFKNR